MKFTSILIPRWRLGLLKGTLMALMFSAICSAGHASGGDYSYNPYYPQSGARGTASYYPSYYPQSVSQYQTTHCTSYYPQFVAQYPTTYDPSYYPQSVEQNQRKTYYKKPSTFPNTPESRRNTSATTTKVLDPNQQKLVDQSEDIPEIESKYPSKPSSISSEASSVSAKPCPKTSSTIHEEYTQPPIQEPNNSEPEYESPLGSEMANQILSLFPNTQLDPNENRSKVVFKRLLKLPLIIKNTTYKLPKRIIDRLIILARNAPTIGSSSFSAVKAASDEDVSNLIREQEMISVLLRKQMAYANATRLEEIQNVLANLDKSAHDCFACHTARRDISAPLLVQMKTCDLVFLLEWLIERNENEAASALMEEEGLLGGVMLKLFSGMAIYPEEPFENIITRIRLMPLLIGYASTELQGKVVDQIIKVVDDLDVEAFRNSSSPYDTTNIIIQGAMMSVLLKKQLEHGKNSEKVNQAIEKLNLAIRSRGGSSGMINSQLIFGYSALLRDKFHVSAEVFRNEILNGWRFEFLNSMN